MTTFMEAPPAGEFQEYLETLSKTLVLVTDLESELPETLQDAQASLDLLAEAITAYNQAPVPAAFQPGHQLLRQSLVTEEVVFQRMVAAYRREDVDIIAGSRRLYENAGVLREQALDAIRAALQSIMAEP